MMRMTSKENNNLDFFFFLSSSGWKLRSLEGKLVTQRTSVGGKSCQVGPWRLRGEYGNQMSSRRKKRAIPDLTVTSE